MQELKLKLLRLAGWLGTEEAMPVSDGTRTLQETVAFICSDKNATPVLFVLVANELALYIDAQRS